jgi:hypothetical protein
LILGEPGITVTMPILSLVQIQVKASKSQATFK